MEQKDFLSQALGFLQSRRQRAWWLKIMTGLAAVVVFVTTYLLILPAITLEHNSMEVTATPSNALIGETLETEIWAKAQSDRKETVFVLAADGDNAGLDESWFIFDEDTGTAEVESQHGTDVELHREYQEDGTVYYWFALKRGQSAQFSLPWVNGMDRYRAAEAEESERSPVTEAGGGTLSEPETGEAGAVEGGTGEQETEEDHIEETDREEAGTGRPDAGGDESREEETEESEAEDGSGETPEPEETEGTGSETDSGILATGSNAAAKAGDRFLARHQTPTVRTRRTRAARITGVTKATKATDSNAEVSEDEASAADPDRTEGDGTGSGVIWEIVLDQEGDPEAEGFLTLSFGCGASLEDAVKNSEDWIELCWLEELETEPFQIPEDAVSWAAVEKHRDLDDASNGIMLLAADVELLDGQENGEGHNFANNITSVTVSRLENGQWKPGTEFTDGDSVRVEINYTIPANTVGADNQTIYYQLPKGIRLSREESGTVYDGQTPVGTYVIETDGMITITFNDTFADDKPFNGMIRFEGTLSADSGGGEQEIVFGGDGGTITVKPNTSPTDIRVEKEGSYDKKDGKLHYTVTVSTTKGTEDTVTISDSFGTGNTSVAYDQNSFQIVKVKPDGTQETVSGYTPEFGPAWTGGPEKFTINGLPKLEAGEKYIVTYTATPGETSDVGGASSVYNKATGTSGGDSNNSGVTVTISQQMLQKWGNYNSGTGKIQWTIKLNPDKQDIGGYILKDTMTIGGETVSIPADTTITMTGSDGSSQTITLPYTFPAGSNDSYTITYETDAPQGEPGQSWTVSNKAELEGDDDHYEAGGNVTGQTQDYNVGKSFDGLDQNASTDKVGTYKWVSRITVPKTDVVLDKLTYTDTLIDASVDGEPVEGSHYITAALLDKLTVTVSGTTLERGTDYQICDAQGKPITDFASENHLTGFQVKFLDAAKDKVTGQTIELRYQTKVDYTKLTDDGIYTIRNKGSIPGHDTESSTTYEPPKKLEKQASITGEGGSSYTDDSITIDYEESGGVIHYRLLIHTDENTKGNITLTDLIPKGATLVEDSVKMAFYGNDWYEYDVNGSGYKASEHIRAEVDATNTDGTTPVTFTIDDGYNGDGQHHVLVVYYDLSVKDDPLWTDDPGLESHRYRNQVTWGSESDTTDVTVEREVPDIKKSGEQLPQYDANGDPVLDSEGNPILSNTIRYAVVINAGAKDLVPDMEFITVWDKLDVGSAAGAEFRPSSVKLYHYDPTQENNCGREIDSSLYTYTYDEKEYVLTFNLPDETACVLVYEYVIDRGNAAGDVHIKNEAHLTGGAGSGGSGDVILEDTSSSAFVTKKVLTLYKVDATNYGKLLPGAVFQLEVYEKDTGWKILLDDLTTDENGQFTLTRIQDEHFDDFNFADNTLYRLTETEPPAGYSAIDTEPYYFVWVEDGKTVDDVKQEMLINGVLGDGTVASESVHFLTTSGAMYIPNQPTELRVKKIWQDESGMTISPGAESVELTLYQQAVETNAKTVVVTSTGHQSWSQTHTQTVNVAEGSGLTIQITGVYKDSLDIQVGSGEKISVPTGSGQVWSYTIESIPKDTTVLISPTDQNEGNSFGNISFSSYTTPSYVPAGDEVIYETVTLNAGNNWSYTWSNLPKQNDKRQTVYYHVREVSPVPGFEVIYSPNNSDGVQAGDLVVINQGNGYVLPEAGGKGIIPFTTGGFALLALAGLMYIILRRKRDEGL